MAFAAWGLFGGVLAGAFFGLGVVPFWPIPRGRRERYTMTPAAAWARFVTKYVLFARVHTQGELQLADGEGAMLLCNHRSWLDPLLLMGWTRSNGLSKREILFIPVIGLMGWLCGAVYFDRREKDARARARDEVLFLVRNGHRIQVFPEGTRSRDGKLRSKVFLTLVRDAWDAGLPVVPCAVMHTDRSLPVGTFTAHPFADVYLEVGETMHPADHESDEAFAIEAWRRVKALVAHLEASA
ncbi:MAG: 1-acyl-sn-glycerol-3-phosphate acyltransferase [Alphaproteobacteria bacterium]|nr:1-acyl-sn-glycerol-3-phosphate acyltransferase [Alphaproteobacteria bacterium]